MDISLQDVENRALIWYEHGASKMLVGTTGIGKTECIANVPTILMAKYEEMGTPKNLGFIYMNAANMRGVDLGGMPWVHDPQIPGQKPYTFFAEPNWFRTIDGKHISEFDGGIILVDEIDKAEADFKKIIGEAALTGRLGDHVIPPGWRIWFAGNRKSDRSGSTKDFDHLINRKDIHEIKASFTPWELWANSAGVLPLTIAFGRKYQNQVFIVEVPKVQGPYLTPRSLVRVDKLLQVVIKYEHKLNHSDRMLQCDIAAAIGEGASHQFMAHIKTVVELPSIDEVCADPMGVRCPTIAELDLQYLMAVNLSTEITGKRLAPMLKYIDRLRPEFSTTFVTAVAKRHPKYIATKELADWCAKHGNLVALLR